MNRLELRAVEFVRANAVRRHLETVFEEGDPPLARITFQSASPRNFKWPYHAKVMKILDTMSNRIVRIRKGAPCTVLQYRLETRKDSLKLLFRQMPSAGLHKAALPLRFRFLLPEVPEKSRSQVRNYSVNLVAFR